jgi:hypothetical protein
MTTRFKLRIKVPMMTCYGKCSMQSAVSGWRFRAAAGEASSSGSAKQRETLSEVFCRRTAPFGITLAGGSVRASTVAYLKKRRSGVQCSFTGTFI